jgi:hypothetical protein
MQFHQPHFDDPDTTLTKNLERSLSINTRSEKQQEQGPQQAPPTTMAMPLSLLEPIPVDTQTMKIVDNVSNSRPSMLQLVDDMKFVIFCLSPLVHQTSIGDTSNNNTRSISGGGGFDEASFTSFNEDDFEPWDFHDSTTSSGIYQDHQHVLEEGTNALQGRYVADDDMVYLTDSMIQFSKDFQPTVSTGNSNNINAMELEPAPAPAHTVEQRPLVPGAPRVQSTGDCTSNCSWIHDNNTISSDKVPSNISTLYDISVTGSHGKSSDDWVKRFEELCLYKQTFGSCAVPHDWKENRALANWVKRQRYQYSLKKSGKHSTLTDARQRALQQIGFRWKLHKAMWNERFAELKEFCDQNGHCNVPSRYAPNSTLAIWVQSQRRQYKLFMKNKTSHMTRERIERLEAIGFEWNGRDVSSTWGVLLHPLHHR